MKMQKSITSAKYLVISASLAALCGKADAALIGYWNFDEGAGTTTADSSPNTNTATQAGAAGSWIGGVDGSAYELGGTTSRFEVVDSSDLAVTGAVTVSAWVNPFAASNFGVIAGIDQTGGTPNDMYSLKTTNSAGDSLNWAVIGPGSNVNLVSTNTLNTLSNSRVDWVHVVGVYDPSGFAGLYINGTLDVSTTNVPTSIQSRTTPFQIGHNASDSGGNALNAAVDDIQIYDQVLSASDVTLLFNNPGKSLDSIPEPSVAALFALAGLALTRRRR